MAIEEGTSGRDDDGSDPLVGQLIANYRVVRRIGQGGMGAVYLAQHTVLGRNAAVKVLLPQYSHNRDLVARFFNEARATAQLRFRGFVEIFDSGTLGDGSAYLVMEYLRGANLAAAIDWREKFTVGETLMVLYEVAASVAHAHARGIVHRDLKPDNVFLALAQAGDEPARGDAVTVKVLDFGIAKLTGWSGAAEAPSARTRTGSLLGTPLYMAPEQCRGAGSVDHRADIYSLGCIAYHALIGQPPFPFEGFGEILSAHINRRPARPRTLVPALPEPVERLVLQLLEKEPAARPQTMQAVMAAVDQLRRAGAGPAPDLKALIPPQALRDVTPSVASPSAPGVATPPMPEATQASPVVQQLAARGRNVHGAVGPTGFVGQTPLQSISTLGAAASELRYQRATDYLRPWRWRGPAIAVSVLGGLAVSVGLVLAWRGSGRSLPGSDSDRRTTAIATPAEARPDKRSEAIQRTPPAPQPPAATAPAATAAPAAEPAVGAGTAAPASRPERPGAAPVVVDTMMVRIKSLPAGASVIELKTGRLLGGTPFEAALPRRDGELELMVRKPGYRAKRVAIDASRNTDVTVTLDKRASAAPTAPDDGDDDRRKL